MATKKSAGASANINWNRPTRGQDRKAAAEALRKSAKGGAGSGGGKKTAAQKTARNKSAAALKKSATATQGKRSQRYAASKYVNFDRMGRFQGYKKSAPKGYVYLPGSRYLTKTSNLNLIRNHTSEAQRKFVRQNRADVEKAIEAASRAGAFKAFGLNRKIGGDYAADFDLGRAGSKFRDKLSDHFGNHSQMQTRRLRAGSGKAGPRARAQWSFAFGQDGHAK